jgi:hypothetical protein
MQITDDITTYDATVVLYHNGSTTSTLTSSSSFLQGKAQTSLVSALASFVGSL